jgi:hypothetical protein
MLLKTCTKEKLAMHKKITQLKGVEKLLQLFFTTKTKKDRTITQDYAKTQFLSNNPTNSRSPLRALQKSRYLLAQLLPLQRGMSLGKA